MAMSIVWVIMVVFSVICGVLTGRMGAVSAAVGEGAQAAVTLCCSMAGILCLWNGVMNVLRRSGALRKLGEWLRPVLIFLLPEYAGDASLLDTVAANVSANLLGLGNAATPLGIRATQEMAKRTPGTASDGLCRFVVLNTASIQLLPTTLISIRGAAGCRTPADILPAVWLCSALSVTVGLLAAWALKRVWRDG